jgi:hypothetical protein
MLPPGASGEFESGANADPAPDAIQHGDQHEMLNGNVGRKGSDRLINGVSEDGAPFLHFNAGLSAKSSNFV